MNMELVTSAAASKQKQQSFWRRLVFERLHRLIAIIIMLQLIQIFRDYWWKETYAIVYGAIVVTAVCELLFTRKYLLRLLLEAAAIAALSARYSPWFEWIGWPLNWKSSEQWALFFDYHIATLHPFFEIGLGVVLAIHAISRLGQHRSVMLAIMMTAIGVMAIFDSFFPLELWHNIAWIVVAGLGWLFILHLRELKERHPDSWEALAERPVELVLPAVIVISLLLLSGIIMPRAPALLEDPYTIWSEAQGRQVMSAGGEGGVLNRGVGSLRSSGSASSGYGRDDSQIGGGFDYDYSPVMTVHSSRRSYWRGETKAIYTGKGWEDLDPQMSPIAVGDETNFGLAERSADVQTETITQTVEILRNDRLPVLFAAGPASRITMLESDQNEGLMSNLEEWELRFDQPARVETYTIESEVTLLDREALRQIVDPVPDSPPFSLEPYLQLPDQLPERVRTLAIEVTSEAANVYDKADMLAKYLRNTYPYSNNPDVSKQVSEDVTDAFLFEIKEGYCDYFSTAFVVMARTLGIPARWVKGYTSGYDPVFEESLRYGGASIEDLNGPGVYTVRNADAHSWAEVYFAGYGWIPFEATSGFSVPQLFVSNASPELDLGETAPEFELAANEPAAAFRWVLPVIGALLVAAVVLAVVLHKRFNILQGLRRIRYIGTTPDQRIVREMGKLLRFLKKRGMKREAHETMREAVMRWSGKFTSLQPEFESILVRFERARYGNMQNAEEEAQAFEEDVSKLRKAL